MKILSNEWRKLDRYAVQVQNGEGQYDESGNYVSFGIEG